jgi:hypothetical protein
MKSLDFGEGCKHGASLIDPWQTRATPSDSVGVVFADSTLPGVKGLRDRAGRSYPQIAGQPSVESVREGFRWDRHREVDVSDLCRGVDARVGSTGADHADSPVP